MGRKAITIALVTIGALCALALSLRHFWTATRPSAKRSTQLRWVDQISPETKASRPNILFVVYDARRRDDFSFGAFGNARADTPFLASFKHDAVYFDGAVSPGCWTIPVHASVFSGLSVGELGIDYYNPGHASFSDKFLSLAEIVREAGYRTIAYADHPYFFNGNPATSLIRGFEQFNVVMDFERYRAITNVTATGAVEGSLQLAGMPEMPFAELRDLALHFNQGGARFDLERDADFDPTRRMYLAKLEDLYANSRYFEKRYREDFDRHVFAGDDRRPFFLFVNLHMCTIARPDPGLYQRWLLRTALLNAQSRGLRLEVRSEEDLVPATLEHAYGRLGLPWDASTRRYLKQVFDNRFYDVTFKTLWGYLEAHGLTQNTATIVMSDHGLSFGEHGERPYLHAGARPYEYMTRVPLILRFPAGAAEARLHGKHTEMVSLTDIFKTTVDLAVGPGVFQRPQAIRGKSLVERLITREFDSLQIVESALRPDTYTALPGVAGYSKAVYVGDLKAIVAPELYSLGDDDWPITTLLNANSGFPRVDRELALLYDLARDPHEKSDLARARPAEVARLVKEADLRTTADSLAAEAPSEWKGDSLETLRSLGYVH